MLRLVARLSHLLEPSSDPQRRRGDHGFVRTQADARSDDRAELIRRVAPCHGHAERPQRRRSQDFVLIAGRKSMPGPVLRTTFQGRNRQDVASDPSFEAVCLLSALGIVFSLIFLLTVGPVFDLGLTE
jgi:hypothetical protein